MLKEACVENFTHVPHVVARGAERVELCDNLAVGGTTPSFGVIQKAVQYCQPHNIPVMVLVRPRGGDFLYSRDEKEIMLLDMEVAIQAGATGVVIGALTEDLELERPFLEQVASKAKEGQVELTFHMAFDRMPPDKQEAALPWLAKTGFARVLTHGGPAEQTIMESIPRLKTLMNSEPQLIIMPGGGVTKDNVTLLEKELPLKEVHGTRIV